MDPAGILLYGYSREGAEAIAGALSGTMNRELYVLSATGMEGDVLSKVIEAGGSREFEEREVKALVFIGLDDDEVGGAMRAFPKGVERPIFAMLTEHNVGWPISELLEHLQEERRAFESMRRGEGDGQ